MNSQFDNVVEIQVGHVRDTQSEESKLQALRTELEMVREQAAQDVEQMRQQLNSAGAQHQAEGGPDDVLSSEAQRQQLLSLQTALAERQRELTRAEASRQVLEDQLEDANGEIERLRQELAVRTEQYNEAVLLSEAVQLQQLEGVAPGPSESNGRKKGKSRRVTDLRDERMLPGGSRPLDIDGMERRGSWLLGVVVGLVLTLGALEAFTMLTGRGELFAMILGR